MIERNFQIGGVFTYNHIRNGAVIDTWKEDNIVVNEGLDYTLDSAFSGGSPITAWYIGLFKNNYAPQASDVAATFPGSGVANEATSEYSQSTRPQWIEAGVVAEVITNTASQATFTFVTPVNIYGAFLASLPTKATTSGKLAAASKFTNVRAMLATDVLTVTYTLTISSI